jgi:hypothetical protein
MRSQREQSDELRRQNEILIDRLRIGDRTQEEQEQARVQEVSPPPETPPPPVSNTRGLASKSFFGDDPEEPQP